MTTKTEKYTSTSNRFQGGEMVSQGTGLGNFSLYFLLGFESCGCITWFKKKFFNVKGKDSHNKHGWPINRKNAHPFL